MVFDSIRAPIKSYRLKLQSRASAFVKRQMSRVGLGRDVTTAQLTQLYPRNMVVVQKVCEALYGVPPQTFANLMWSEGRFSFASEAESAMGDAVRYLKGLEQISGMKLSEMGELSPKDIFDYTMRMIEEDKIPTRMLVQMAKQLEAEQIPVFLTNMATISVIVYHNIVEGKKLAPLFVVNGEITEGLERATILLYTGVTEYECFQTTTTLRPAPHEVSMYMGGYDLGLFMQLEKMVREVTGFTKEKAHAGFMKFQHYHKGFHEKHPKIPHPKWGHGFENVTGAMPEGTWEYNRYGHYTLTWDDGRELYLQVDTDVESFTRDLGYTMDDMNAGDHDKIPDSVSWDYWNVAEPASTKRKR